MKHRILCFLLAAVLLLSAVPAVHAEAALSGEEQYDLLTAVEELIRRRGLTSSEQDEPLRRALTVMLEKDPDLLGELLDGMLTGYDPYTMFLPADSYTSAFSPDKSYVGVGVTVQSHPLGALVVDVHPYGPAAEKGVRMGDVITAVNGKNVAMHKLSVISEMLRGAPGTNVQIRIQRGEESKTMYLRRTKLEPLNFFAQPMEDGITYMKWSRIADDNSYVLFRQSMEEMMARGDSCLLLDLRGNPGGVLDLAFSIVSDFMPEPGPFFKTAARNPLHDGELLEKFIIAEGGGYDVPHIYVLVDGESASAAEIIAASLRDAVGAELIGTKTYGKGRAQQHIVLADDSAIILTTMKLLSLNDGDYHEIGLLPDHLVNNTIVEGKNAILVPDSVALAPYSCSDNAVALNRALVELGLLEQLPEKPYQLGDDTMEALKKLKASQLLRDPEPGAGPITLRMVNRMLIDQLQGRYVRDDQLAAALKLAREALAADAEQAAKDAASGAEEQPSAPAETVPAA